MCVCRERRWSCRSDGHRGRESYQMAQVIDFKPKYLVRGIPTDYRLYRAIPVGVWHTNSPVYGEFYRQNLPAPYLRYLVLGSSPTFQAPERHPRSPGQASHFILTSFYFNMIGSREAGFFRWFMPLPFLGPGAVPAPNQKSSPPPDIYLTSLPCI